MIAIIIATIAYPLIYFRSYYSEKIANPYEITSQNLLLSLAYYKVMHETYLGNYSYAKSILKLISNTSFINNPEINDLVKRFNTYINMIITQLNETENNISLGYHYLEIGNLSYSYNLSLIALNTLKKANASTLWLSYLGSVLKNSIGPYSYLTNGINEIKKSEGNLTSFIYELQNDIYESKGNVSVKLYSNVSSAWLGNTTKIYGNVTYLNIGLANATVMILFYNNETNLTTNDSGNFSINYKIPYIYENKTCIYAYFIPYKYENLRENSSFVCIKLNYFKPKINLNTNNTNVLPDTYIKIYGNYSENNTYSNFGQQYLFIEFNNNLIKVRLNYNGTFSYNLLIPNVENGNYTIKAFVPSHELYYKSTSSINIKVYRLFTNISVITPLIAIAGQTITIHGKLFYNSTPIKGIINVYAFNENKSSITNPDGSFSLNIKIPIYYMNFYSTILINSTANENIYNPAYATKRIIIINPLFIAFGITILFGGSRYAYALNKENERKKKKEKRGEEIRNEVNRKRQNKIDLKREEIRNAFNVFINNVKTFLGIDLEEYMTLREYFSLIKNKVRNKEDMFDKINKLLEKEIYGYGLSEEERNELLILLSVRLND